MSYIDINKETNINKEDNKVKTNHQSKSQYIKKVNETRQYPTYNVKVINNTNIIETELLRKQLYQNIIVKISEKLHTYLQPKEIKHFLLRYVFNKIIERKPENDPIFIPEPSIICNLQVEKDFEFKKILIDVKEFIEYLDDLLMKASETISKSKEEQTINNDSEITYDNINKIFTYKNNNYRNISELCTNNKPELYNYCIALNIRYTYMNLSTHGLARDYYKMGYTRTDGVEIFASSFNHYFDLYHSAFPDLEKPFGSLGSFFSSVDNILLKYAIETVITCIRNGEYNEGMEKRFNESFFMSDIYKKNTKCSYYKSSKSKSKNKVMFVNPPFDMVLMSIVFFVFEHLNIEHRTIFTVPNWGDFLFLERIKKHTRTKKTVIYPKGSLKFINHMNNKRIYPCDIAEIYLYPNQ